MNIALVDDLPQDLAMLEKSLKEYALIHNLKLELSSFSSAEALLASYQPYQYTIVFLDIYLNGLTGIEAAEAIRKVDDDVLLVFLTTSEEHRSEAFQYYASAYLVKSSDNEQAIFKTMDHLLHLKTERDEKRFFFVSSRHEYSLRHADIVSLETDGNYMVVTDAKGNTYKTRMLFSDAEKVFSSDKRFLSILRGVIVNLDYVVKITEDSCRLVGNMTYPVNRKKSKSIQQIWHNYNFEKLREESLWKRKPS